MWPRKKKEEEEKKKKKRKERKKRYQSDQSHQSERAGGTLINFQAQEQVRGVGSWWEWVTDTWEISAEYQLEWTGDGGLIVSG